MRREVVWWCFGALFCLVLLSPSCRKRQDSVSMTLQEERLIVWDNPDSAMTMLGKIDTNLLNEHERDIYRLEYMLAQSRLQQEQYRTEVIEELLSSLLEYDDALSIGEAYYMLGTSSIHASRYEASTSYLKLAEEWLLTANSKKPSANYPLSVIQSQLSTQLLGVTWFCLGNTSESEMLYSIAHEYYRKAIPLLEKRSNGVFLACAYRDLARTNALTDGNPDSTRVWFVKADNYAVSAGNMVLAADIDAYYYTYCEPDSIDARLNACKVLAETYGITTRYSEMVEIYLARHLTDSAAYYLTKLQPTDSTYSYWFEQNYAYWDSKLKAETGESEEAYNILLNLYDKTINQLQTDASARTFAIAQHYDVEREQQKTIEAQREQHWQKRLSVILVFTLGVTILLLVNLFLYYRVKRKEQMAQMQALRDKYVQQLQLALERLRQKVSLTKEIELQRMRGNEVEFPKWLQTYRNEKLVMNKESIDELIASIDKALDGAVSRLRTEFPSLTESDMQYAILSIIGATDNDMSIVLNVQKQTIYHRRQIVRKHVDSEIADIDVWLRQYVLSV